MKIHEGIHRDILRLIIWYPVRWLLMIAPLSFGFRLLDAMGNIHHFASRGKKASLLRNLTFVQPARDTEKANEAVLRYFQNHYVDRLCIFLFPRLDAGAADALVEFSGREHLDAALAKGKGVILVHGHFGPVHIPLVVLARYGYRMKQIGLPSDEGLSWIGKNVAFRLRMKYEGMMPAEIIKADSFLRGAFTWLRGNGVIMMTGDGSGTDRHVGRHDAFPFFGHTLQFPMGPALLAGKTDSELLPLFIIPGEKKRYRIVIEPALASANSGPERVRDLTGQFVRRIEQYEGLYPGFMHFLDRFHPGGMLP